MKSTVNLANVYSRILSDSSEKEIIPIEYRAVQKYQSTEKVYRFIELYSKTIYIGGDSIPDSPLLSDYKGSLLVRYK